MAKKNKKQKKVAKHSTLSERKVTVNQKRWLPAVDFPLTQVAMNLPLRLLIFMVFFSIFALYVSHVTPFISGGDGGELITSAYLLGIPHPPGYPLFNLLGKLFSLIPIQNVAWRVNLSSAVFQLGASFFIYLSVYQLTKFWPAALLGSLFYSFSPLIWEYSLKAEVFPLNNLFAAIILYLIVLSRKYWLQYEAGILDKKHYEDKSRMIVYWTLFTCGLSLTNHHTIILLAPGVLLGLYSYNRTILFRGPTLLLALGAFVLGLMVYLYIPIRAASLPYLNWDNAQTLRGFIDLVTRKDYGSFTLLSSTAAVFRNDEKYLIYLSDLWKQISPLGLIMALLGVVLLLRQKEKKLGIILLLFYLLSSFFFITLANVIRNDTLFLGVFQRFYMLSLVVITVFIGLGVYFLQHLLLLYFKEKKIGLVLRGLILSITLLISLIPLKTIQSPSNIIHNFAQNVLKSLEPNAVLFIEGDSNVGALLYLQLVEGVRKDVILLLKNILYLPSYVEQMKRIYPTLNIPFFKMDNQFHTFVQLIEANLEKKPFYFVGILDTLPGVGSDYHFIPTGIVTQIRKTNLDLPEHAKKMLALWASYDLSNLSPFFSPTTFEKEIVNVYAYAHFKLALDYLHLSWDDLSIIEFNKAVQLNEVGLNSAYKNIGLIYAERKHDPKNAIINFNAFMRMNPEDAGNQNLLQYIQYMHEHTQTA